MRCKGERALQPSGEDTRVSTGGHKLSLCSHWNEVLPSDYFSSHNCMETYGIKYPSHPTEDTKNIAYFNAIMLHSFSLTLLGFLKWSTSSSRTSSSLGLVYFSCHWSIALQRNIKHLNGMAYTWNIQLVQHRGLHFRAHFSESLVSWYYAIFVLRSCGESYHPVNCLSQINITR